MSRVITTKLRVQALVGGRAHCTGSREVEFCVDVDLDLGTTVVRIEGAAHAFATEVLTIEDMGNRNTLSPREPWDWEIEVLP